MLKIVYPYYNNQAAFDGIKGYLSQLPCQIVIVDDGSPTPLTTNIPNIKILRIPVDIPWNQSMANNLGIKFLDLSDVVLRLDIDHFILPDDYFLFEKIATYLPERMIYRFRRMVADSDNILKIGCNLLMIRVKDFCDIGGYDESFSGNYGYEDKEFIDRAKMMGYNIDVSQEGIIRCFPHCGTKMVRDTTVNKAKYDALRKARGLP